MSKNDSFMNLASIYDLFPDDGYDDYIEKIFQSINNRYPNLIDATLVDIGGGTGRVAYHIFDRVGKVILIEPSEEMLNIAKKKFYPINTKISNLNKVVFLYLALKKIVLISL